MDPQAPLTVVLVGRTGNGKSATGNSILRKNAFIAKKSLKAVTMNCDRKTGTLPDGRVIHVVDTPGFFEVGRTHEEVKDEIAKCMEWAKDGIHAVLLVLSTKSRVSMEEVEVIETTKVLFGDRVLDFVIVVFTAADELEEDEITLDDFCKGGPEELQDLLRRCVDRKIAFDNKTKDEFTKLTQVNELLKIVAEMVKKNNGEPYTTDLFREAKLLAEIERKKQELEDSRARGMDVKLQMEKMEQDHALQMKSMMAMIESKMVENQERWRLEASLEDERRRNAELEARANKAKDKARRAKGRLAELEASRCSIM